MLLTKSDIASFSVLVIIAFLVAVVFIKLINDKKKGRSIICGGDCSHCAVGCNNKQSSIKYVFLDLDDTIFDFTDNERMALSATLEHIGVVPNDNILSRYSEINLSRWKLMELGQISREEVKVSRYKLLFDEFSIKASPEEATAFYENCLASSYSFINGAKETLKALCGEYKLYLVSNGEAAVQNSRLDASGIRKYFDGIFISQDVGADKPNKEFFDYCFSKINNFSKHNAVIVGDSISSDIKGGINAGIKTIWFNHRNESSEVKADFIIKSLYELPALLERI